MSARNPSLSRAHAALAAALTLWAPAALANTLFNADIKNTTGNVANDYHVRMEADEPITVFNTYEVGGTVQFADAGSTGGISGNGTNSVTINWTGATLNQGDTTHVGASNGIGVSGTEPLPKGLRITESWWTFGGAKLVSATSGRLPSATFNASSPSSGWLVVQAQLFGDASGGELIGTIWIEARGENATLTNDTFDGPIFARMALRGPERDMVPLEDLNPSLGGFGAFGPMLVLPPASPSDCLGDLVDATAAAGLSRGMAASLGAKLSAAAAREADGDLGAAANVLEAFLHELAAQSGKHVPEATADTLSRMAQGCLAGLRARMASCLAPPATDLAGYLDPLLPALFVRPEDELPVLDQLDARPLGANLFVIDAVTLDGSLRPLQFEVILVDEPARAVRPGELIIDVADYKVYKNAECKFLDHWAEIPCGPHPNTTQRSKVTYNPRHKCLHGRNYCTEVNAIWWVRTFYDDAGCTLAVNMDFGKDYLCKP